MANPAAVADAVGEWFELINLDDVAVNLLGWSLQDLGSDHTVVTAEVWVAPGDYVVLARSGDMAANGGVLTGYTYSGLDLANQSR